MANTQSKRVPYAKDRHRLTNTNVALATEGGNRRNAAAEKADVLPAERGAARWPPQLPAGSDDTAIPVSHLRASTFGKRLAQGKGARTPRLPPAPGG